MKFFIMGLILIYSIVLNGCISKMGNIFTDTKKASVDNMRLGKINKNAPIIKEPKKPAVEVKINKMRLNKHYQREFEMVGYIISRYKDPEFDNLYLYTFTDALRSEKIQFFSRKRLNYSSRVLVRVYIKDNFLKKIERYKSIEGKRKKGFIEAAKEYLIRF